MKYFIDRLMSGSGRIATATVFGVRLASLLLVIYWVALFTGTHIPPVGVPRIDNIDKLLHFSAFAGLAFLLAWAIPTQAGKPRWNVLIASLAAIGYAAIDEFSQIPVGRTADMWDWLADCAGVTLGLVAYLAMRTMLVRRRLILPVRLPTPQ